MKTFIPELDHYLNISKVGIMDQPLISNDLVNCVIDNQDIIYPASVLNMLFNENYECDNYSIYFMDITENIGQIYFKNSPSLLRRLMLYKLKGYDKTAEVYLTFETGSDIFEINNDRIMLDKLLEFRKNLIVNLDDINYDDLENAFQKVLYMYLKVNLDITDYTYYNDRDIIQDIINLPPLKQKLTSLFLNYHYIYLVDALKNSNLGGYNVIT